MKNTTIVIPTWNGVEILKKSLPIVKKFASRSPIVVIDDGSVDETALFLKQHSDIKVISNETNLGFTKSVNKALDFVATEFLCLLNNDVYPHRGFIENAKKIMDDDPGVAAVTFNEENSSWPKVAWENGKLSFSQGNKDGFNHFCMWPSGGSCLIRTEVFRSMGGFLEVFSPGYFEDIELGFRIWRAGGKVVWAKDAVVTHRHETSFSKLDPGFVQDLKQSNELVFTWLTFYEYQYLIDHIRFLITYTAIHPGYLRIIIKALLKFVTVVGQKQTRTIPIAYALQMANQRYE